jgi:hypothetical protein
MSFARDARDTAASLFYLKCLDELRGQFLDRATRGEKFSPHYWAQGEARAIERVKREYFTTRLRALFMPSEKAATVDDAQDFELRNTRLIEAGMLDSHRKLVAIPWVGQPEFVDVPE